MTTIVRIDRSNNKQTINIGYVHIGDVFCLLDKNRHYLRTDMTDGENYLCVSLTSFHVHKIPYDTMVAKVQHTEIIITE